MDVAPPLADGRYRLLKVLGEGGMAIVYLGYDERLEVERAVKVLSPLLSSRADIRKRFETEARTMAQLQHPNIVSVQDVGTDGDRVYMVMELVATGSLIDKLDREGAMPPHAACDAIIAILSGLQIAHARGVVHRDIKPHNVLVTPDGQYKVADFGIAHVSGADRSATRTGMAMGTLSYMAPEQRSNAKQVDGRADLYAVSATFYALLTNTEPFELHAADHQEEIFKGIPSPLVDVMKRASRFRADDRFPDAAAMITAVREARAMISPTGAPLQRRVGTGNPTLALAQSESYIGSAPLGVTASGAADPRPAARDASHAGSGTFAAAALDPMDPLDDLQPEPSGAEPPSSPAAASGTPQRTEPHPATLPTPGTLAPKPLEHDKPSIHPDAEEPARSPGRGWVIALVGVLALAALGAVGAGMTDRSRATQTASTAAPPPGPAAPAAPATPVPAPSTTTLVAEPVPPPVAAVTPSIPTPSIPTSSVPTPSSKAPVVATKPAAAARPSAAPVAAEPPAAAPPASAAMQTLFINSQPYSNVTVDGKAVGSTGWNGTVKVGKHRVGLTTAAGQTKAIDLTVKETEPRRYCWDFTAEAECSR